MACAISPEGKSSGSDLVDRPRLLFPDDELERSPLGGPVGVRIEEIGMPRVTGGRAALASSAIGCMLGSGAS